MTLVFSTIMEFLLIAFSLGSGFGLTLVQTPFRHSSTLPSMHYKQNDL